jgi:hypothetical protein
MFTEIYKDSHLQAMSAQATKSLVQMLLVDNARGANKSNELTGMNMESTFNYTLLPSMIYTFLYNSPDSEHINETNFKDHIPVILCTSFDGKYVTGINFNLIPNDIRANLLDIIYNAFKNFYTNDVEKAVAKNKATINEKFANLLVNEKTRADFLKILNDKLGINVSNAYRVYDVKYIKNVRLIEYDNWKYVPFLSFKDSVRGAGLATLQRKMVDRSKKI